MNLFVPGIPKPTQTGSVVRTKDGRAFPQYRNTGWSTYVRAYVAAHKPEQLLTGPVVLHVQFILPNVKDKKRIYPVVRPDLDNLSKKLLDNLQGLLFAADSQVVNLHLEKRYVKGSEFDGPGVYLAWWEYQKEA